MALVDGDAQTKDGIVESVSNSLAEAFSLLDESIELFSRIFV